MTARNNSRMHLPFFCRSLSKCEYTFSIMITVLKIAHNNDNRGCHLEFYSHTRIGNWFQCFPVYPVLNLSSGSGSGFWIPDSGFSIRPFCIDFFNADIPVFISLQIIIVVFGGGGGGDYGSWFVRVILLSFCLLIHEKIPCWEHSSKILILNLKL